VEAVAAGVVAIEVSVLEAEAALVALGVLGAPASLTGVATGVGVGATAEAVGAGEEEVFFAILCWYTLLSEVFLSIFRHYIL
jgi:tetrahydromethanopterin S-methyltransferase subunit D